MHPRIPFKSLLTRSNSVRFFNTNTNAPAKAQPLVRVSAFDHDGCVGLRYRVPSEIPKSHPALIELLDKKKSEIHYVTSFSNQQSARSDCHNALCNQNSLAFPVAIVLARALGAYFDPLLLSDIAANQKPGYTISSIRQDLAEQNIDIFESQLSDSVLLRLMARHTFDYVYSEDKVNIIYAQAHRIALMHPNAKIVFDIFDNLQNEVLEPAAHFFKKSTMLLPKNTELNFYHYCTVRDSLPLPDKLFTLNGNGIVDSDYYQTVKAMGRVAQEVEGKQISKYHMANYLSLDLIRDTRLSTNPLVATCGS